MIGGDLSLNSTMEAVMASENVLREFGAELPPCIDDTSIISPPTDSSTLLKEYKFMVKSKESYYYFQWH